MHFWMKVRCMPGAILAAAALCALLTGCASSTTGGVSGNRSQLLLLPESEVIQLSLQDFQKQNARTSALGTLITSGSEFNRVSTIMRRMVPQTGVFRPDAMRWPWQLVLINSNELNAHVRPGGKVTMYTGMLRRLNMSDDEIAAVIGHEMAHALREHTRERMSQQVAGDLLLSVGGSLLGASQGTMTAVGMARDLALDMPFSRAMESEADGFGMELAARAGYNPAAALTLWDKMRAAGAGQGPSFLSTHPSAADRTQRIRAALPRVMPLYEAARR